MNPALILQMMAVVKAAMDLGPVLIRDGKAIIQAASATPAQLEELKAAIDEMDKARNESWSEATAALAEAAKH